MKFDNRLKAAEKLRKLKDLWDVSWKDLAEILGGVSVKSLSVYASQGNSGLMPDSLTEIILDLDETVNPILKSGPSSDVAIVLTEGKWVMIDSPILRQCAFCHRYFIPTHPQQAYCDTYTGDCGLAMRRERRRLRKGQLHGR